MTSDVIQTNIPVSKYSNDSSIGFNSNVLIKTNINESNNNILNTNNKSMLSSIGSNNNANLNTNNDKEVQKNIREEKVVRILIYIGKHTKCKYYY